MNPQPLTLVALLLAVLAGCVAAPVQPITADDAPLASHAPPSVAAMVPRVRERLTANTTSNDTVDYQVTTDGPLVVEVRLNGTLLDRATIDANHTWTLPLAFGHNPFEARLTAPNVSVVRNETIVRLAATRIRVDYGAYHPASQGVPKSEERTLWIDVDARPTAAQYEAHAIHHADYYTAHDQLYEWSLATHKPVEFTYYPSFQGYAVTRIDGAGNPVDSSLPPWWCFTRNNATGDGISIQPVLPGDRIVWTLGSCT